MKMVVADQEVAFTSRLLKCKFCCSPFSFFSLSCSFTSQVLSFQNVERESESMCLKVVLKLWVGLNVLNLVL
jgi:hypothetical protein